MDETEETLNEIEESLDETEGTMDEIEESQEPEELGVYEELPEVTPQQYATDVSAHCDAPFLFLAGTPQHTPEVGRSSPSGSMRQVRTTPIGTTPQIQDASMSMINDHIVNPVKQANIPVEFAFHVTNVSCENPKPKWKKLKWNPIDDPYFDGKILHHAPCVCFMTTKWGDDILTRSLYPRSGQPGENYWCIKVPLNYFDQYDILWIHEQKTPSAIQVRLLLLKEEDAKCIAPKIRQELQRRAETYLRREKTSGSNNCAYYSNDYKYGFPKYFVNFAICESFQIPDDSDLWWVPVEHGDHLSGIPEDETSDQKKKSRKERKHDLIERINSICDNACVLTCI